jgi:hypothetical protein
MLSSRVLSNSNVLKSPKVYSGKDFELFDPRQMIKVITLYVVGVDRFASLDTIAVSVALWKTLRSLWKTQDGCGKI